LLELESELPNLVDGNKNAWQQHLERELDVSPRWVWDVDLETMFLQAKELFEKSKAMA
jgi:salicylate hydroxylase